MKGGKKLAGRNAYSVEAIIANGNKSHLTKKEIEERQKNEALLKKLSRNTIKPPKWLGKEGKKIFKDIVDELQAIEILVNADSYGLAIMSDTLEKYIKCTIALHAEDLKIENYDKKGNVNIVENPTVKTQLKYLDAFHKYASVFGLSPAARIKLIQNNMPELDDEDQEFESEFES